MNFMKYLGLLGLLGFLIFSMYGHAEECTPEATQKLGSLTSRVTRVSASVDQYKKKWKTESSQESDLIVYCLSRDSGRELLKVYDDAVPAVNELEEFGNHQTGPCKEAALKASSELEGNVRQLMELPKKCDKSKK